MDLSVREVLSRITTMPDMVRAFRDEDHCRHLLEAMVWPTGRICPACGYRRSIALTDRENGKRARPGLYQCSSGTYRFQFTVTTRTPLHATKLPLRVWLSRPVADAAVGQGHLFHSPGGSARCQSADGLAHGACPAPDGRTQARPGWCGRDRRALSRRQAAARDALIAPRPRPPDLTVGAPSGEARAAVIEDLSGFEADQILTESVEPSAHLMSDEWKAFVSLGSAFAAHDTVSHSAHEYARGPGHINSAESFNDHIRRTVSGVFHHISPHLADLNFNEIGFHWYSGSSPAKRRVARARDVR